MLVLSKAKVWRHWYTLRDRRLLPALHARPSDGGQLTLPCGPCWKKLWLPDEMNFPNKDGSFRSAHRICNSRVGVSMALFMSLQTALCLGYCWPKSCSEMWIWWQGVLRNGKVVAVKRIFGWPGNDELRFVNELGCLMRMRAKQNKNIVRFLGYHRADADTQGKADERHGLLSFEYPTWRRETWCVYHWYEDRVVCDA